ncbi:MAG: class I SAM-dependent methyltransferase [Patescibacteria group bacterium]|jgi:ubiquinone/menaquinone biosynthesis C-methylase UbiE
MNVKKIYEARFVNVEQRKLIWQVLVSDFFQRFIKKNDVVLDIGCGYGEFINNIVCGKKFAVDLNKSVKRYLDKDIRFFSESSTKMPSIKDSSIDKIFVSNFFEHIKKEDIIKTIDEFKKKLKTHGEVLVLQPNIRFCAKDYWMFFDHITALDDRVLVEVFSSKGFRLKKIILKFLPFTMKSILPKLPIFVKLYLKLPFLWQIFGKQSFLIFEKL